MGLRNTFGPEHIVRDIVTERNVFIYASREGSGKSAPSLLDDTISTVPKSHMLV